jgi:hypothetical protein
VPCRHRVLLLHKQKTSGRLRYLRFPEGVLFPAPLPEGAALRPAGFSSTRARLLPTGYMREVEVFLALPPGGIAGEPEFSAWARAARGMEVVGGQRDGGEDGEGRTRGMEGNGKDEDDGDVEGDVAILLGAFTAIDPPFAAAAGRGGRFVTLAEARGLPRVELEIMRRAYEHVLG